MATASGLDTSHIGNIVSMHGDAFWGNGWDPCKVWDGWTTVRDVGLSSYGATPSAGDGAAGSVTAGAHSIRCRYMRGAAEYVGDASPEYSYTAPGSKKANVKIIGTSAAGVDTIVVEMTTVGGSTWYQAGRFTNSSQTGACNRKDTTLSANPLDWDSLGHIAPRVGSVLLEHKGCLLVAGPAVHSDGTVTSSGAILVGTGTNWKSVVADEEWYFLASSTTEALRVVTHTSATQLTLSEAPASALSGVGYKLFSPHQNKVGVSKPLIPESFGDTDGAYRQQEVLQGRSDVLRSCKSWGDYVVVYGEHGMEKWTWMNDITDGRIYDIPGDRGAAGHKLVRSLEGRLYSMDRMGMTIWEGGAPEAISGPVDPLIDNVNWAQWTKFHCAWNPDKRLLMWFVATGSATECKTAFCYNVDEQTWHTRLYDYGWASQDTMPDSDGVMRPFFFDENGYSWFDGLGWNDGLHPTGSVTLTCDSGSTTATTNVVSTDTLYFNGGSGMAGVPLHFTTPDLTRYATSTHASNNQIYLASALTTAPSAGDEIEVGKVRAAYKTKAFKMGEPPENVKGYYFCLDFIPTPESRNLIVRVYKNLSETPESSWESVSNQQEGVTFVEDSADITVDLSTAKGHIMIPLSDEWHHTYEFELEVADSDVRLQCLGYYVFADVLPEARP